MNDQEFSMMQQQIRFLQETVKTLRNDNHNLKAGVNQILKSYARKTQMGLDSISVQIALVECKALTSFSVLKSELGVSDETLNEIYEQRRNAHTVLQKVEEAQKQAEKTDGMKNVLSHGNNGNRVNKGSIIAPSGMPDGNPNLN